MGEGVVRVTDKRQQTLHDRENYIDFRMRLLGEPDTNYPMDSEGLTTSTKDQGPIPLSPGIHSFPFKLGLPLGLPSTFLGKHGWVQYFCRAALREGGGLTHKNQQVFIVMNPIDLNLEPSILAQPFLCEIEHRLGLACLAGPINCRVRLDRGGYVPGEHIVLWARVKNNSRVSIRRTRACLTETIQYMSRNKVVETELRELSTAARGRIPSGGTDEWPDEQLTVPPLPPTNLRGCHVIRIQYDVFFIIEPSGIEKDIKLQLPIMLATYPHREGEGSLKRPAHYPQSLPIFRPWLEDKEAP
ncbi:Arrestin C-terminal-like domain [Trinorchestia longiramus]|nr:Arrestin C-terminal-like domain [Trinorchestia longiramus]